MTRGRKANPGGRGETSSFWKDAESKKVIEELGLEGSLSRLINEYIHSLKNETPKNLALKAQDQAIELHQIEAQAVRKRIEMEQTNARLNLMQAGAADAYECRQRAFVVARPLIKSKLASGIKPEAVHHAIEDLFASPSHAHFIAECEFKNAAELALWCVSQHFQNHN
jgi:hypothetical protein